MQTLLNLVEENASATLQRLMSRVIADVTQMYDSIILCYLDDVVFATLNLLDTIDRLSEVFKKVIDWLEMQTD